MQQAPDTSRPAPRLRAQAQWVRRRRGPGEVRPRAWVGVAWALAPPLDLGHGRRRRCGSLSYRTPSGESGGAVAGARHYSHQLGSWREGRVLPVLSGMIFPRSVSSLRTEPLSRAASGTAIQETLSSSSRRPQEHFWKRDEAFGWFVSSWVLGLNIVVPSHADIVWECMRKLRHREVKLPPKDFTPVSVTDLDCKIEISTDWPQSLCSSWLFSIASRLIPCQTVLVVYLNCLRKREKE